MKVYELIEELQKCNPEADVVIDMSDRIYSEFDIHVDPVSDDMVYICDDKAEDDMQKYTPETIRDVMLKHLGECMYYIENMKFNTEEDI